MDAKYLIIGNSTAGVNCIEAIREKDKKGKIIVISDERTGYSRPLISYYLAGRITEDDLFLKRKNFYEENAVHLLLDEKVQRLDVTKKLAFLKNKKRLKYQKLLIATGGVPVIPFIDALDDKTEGVFTFTKIADAKNILNYIQKNRIKDSVVLGAGLIGLKTTEALLEREIKIKIVELSDKILANTFDKEASLIIEKRLKERGCEALKENTIKRIEKKNGRIEKVILKDGKNLSTKLLILAIGVKPNLELVKGTLVKTDRGILVNKFMQTNIDNVYAAGDVAQAPDFSNQRRSVIAIWPVAAREGKTAGFNMAGQKQEYQPLFIMNSVQISEIPSISFGETNPKDKQNCEILKKKNFKDNVYKKIVLKNGRIVGVILLNCIERAGIYGALIKEKIDVSSFKDELLKENFGFLVLPAEFRKHFVTGEGIEI